MVSRLYSAFVISKLLEKSRIVNLYDTTMNSPFVDESKPVDCIKHLEVAAVPATTTNQHVRRRNNKTLPPRKATTTIEMAHNNRNGRRRRNNSPVRRRNSPPSQQQSGQSSPPPQQQSGPPQQQSSPPPQQQSGPPQQQSSPPPQQQSGPPQQQQLNEHGHPNAITPTIHHPHGCGSQPTPPPLADQSTAINRRTRIVSPPPPGSRPNSTGLAPSLTRRRTHKEHTRLATQIHRSQPTQPQSRSPAGLAARSRPGSPIPPPDQLGLQSKSTAHSHTQPLQPAQPPGSQPNPPHVHRTIQNPPPGLTTQPTQLSGLQSRVRSPLNWPLGDENDYLENNTGWTMKPTKKRMREGTGGRQSIGTKRDDVLVSKNADEKNRSFDHTHIHSPIAPSPIVLVTLAAQSIPANPPHKSTAPHGSHPNPPPQPRSPFHHHSQTNRPQSIAINRRTRIVHPPGSQPTRPPLAAQSIANQSPDSLPIHLSGSQINT
jgi:hypothetical protein